MRYQMIYCYLLYSRRPIPQSTNKASKIVDRSIYNHTALTANPPLIHKNKNTAQKIFGVKNPLIFSLVLWLFPPSELSVEFLDPLLIFVCISICRVESESEPLSKEDCCREKKSFGGWVLPMVKLGSLEWLFSVG